jgi:hypothetical protein
MQHAIAAAGGVERAADIVEQSMGLLKGFATA